MSLSLLTKRRHPGRRHIRFAADPNESARVSVGDCLLAMLIVDQSKSGCQLLSLASQPPLPVGGEVDLELGRLPTARARVVWASDLAGVARRFGLEFVDSVS